LKQFSIRQYVAWLTLIPLLVLSFSLGMYFLNDRFDNLDQHLIEEGRLIAHQLATSSEFGVFTKNKSFLNNIAQGSLQEPDVRGVIILNAASESIVKVGGFAGESGDTASAAKPAISSGFDATQRITARKVETLVNNQTRILRLGRSLFFYQPILPIPVTVDEFGVSPVAKQAGAVILELSWARTDQLKSRMIWVTISITSLFLTLSIFWVFFASRRITAPIRNLSDAVQMIGYGRLETRISVPDNILELRSLADGVNVMAALLQQESKNLHQQIADATHLAATAFESHESMMITDASSVILRVNQAFTEDTGYTAEEIVGQTPRLLKSGRHNAEFYREMWESIHRTGKWEGEIWDRRKNGEIYPKWLTISAVKDADGVVTHFVGSHIDITERKASEEKIQNLAFYDPLTGLPNRRLLLDRLQHALASSERSGRSGALVFLDLDHFKTLNDTLGHDVGDLLLQQVAQRLTSCVRNEDTVARLGGDEFMVVLEVLDEDAQGAAAQTEAINEKIQAALNQTYQLGVHQYRSTPSIGVTVFHGHQTSIEDLMKQADIAMYQAKQTGRNRVRFFDPKMQASVDAHAALEHDLREALDRQQFQLYYQVQVDSMNRPVGAEALINWNHPLRGMVSPAQFIPLAEETGLILPIGLWVMEMACVQLKVWEQDMITRDLVLAVNVSAKQFHQAGFVNQVQAVIQRHAINPARLKLELTEGVFLTSIEDTIDTMNTLNRIGVRFSLDDFGTGYSSLQYLKRLPLDQIKIDQSFVRDIATDPNDAVIVQTIIVMAEALELNVVAEGVETEAQREFLELRGCTHYQGYLFGRPVPIEEFHALLKQS
jgi:diguanylate cyclase (GGDEF)-like protein/PAS domain S-box-containing protein